MYFLRSKVFAKIFISFLLLLVISMGTVGFFSYYMTNSIVKEKTNHINQLYVDSIKSDFDKLFADLHNQILLINSNPWLREVMIMNGNIDQDRIEKNQITYIIAQLNNIRGNYKVIKEISIVLYNTNIVISTSGLYTKDLFFEKNQYESQQFKGVSDLPWDTKSLRIIPNVRHYSYGSYLDDVSLYFRPLLINAPPYRAMLMLHLDYKVINDMLNKSSFGDKAFLSVLDSELNTLYTNLYNDKILNNIDFSNKTGSGTLEYQDKQHDYFFTSSANGYYKYAVMVDSESTTKDIATLRNLTLIVSAIALVIGFFICYIAAKINYKPLMDLIAHVLPNDYKNNLGWNTNEYIYLENAVDSLNVQKEQLAENIQQYAPIVKHNYIKKLLNGTLIKDNTELSDSYGNDLFTKPYFVSAVINIEIMNKYDSDVRKDINSLSSFLNSLIEELFNKEKLCCYSIEEAIFSYSILFNLQEDENIVNVIKKVIGEIKNFLKEQYEIVIVSGLGKIVDCQSSIYISHQQAKTALENKFVLLNSEVISFEHIVDTSTYPLTFSPTQQMQLTNIFLAGNKQELIDLVDSILEKNFLNETPNKVGSMYVIYSLVAAAMNALEQSAIDDNSIFKATKKIPYLKNLIETRNFIEQLYNDVYNKIHAKKKRPSDQLMENIITYLDENYYKSNISLTMVSEQFNLTGIYISRLIRDYTGINYIDYINNKRIELATELLSDKSKTIKEIALEVGYDSDLNFRRVFKKYKAVTPGQFRDILI